jgi:hypothetical protein
MKNLLKILGISALTFTSCSDKSNNETYPLNPQQQEQKLVTEPFKNTESAQESILNDERREFIKEYGYGIKPTKWADVFLVGGYNIPMVAIHIKEGDTLEEMSRVMYNNPNNWDELVSNNKENLKSFKQKDKLPSNLQIKTYMIRWVIDIYKKDFPERKVEIIEK